MWFILRYAKLLVLVTVLAAGISYAASAGDGKAAARVGSDNISVFEVKSFVNTVVPMGKIHAGSLNKEEYWDEALDKAVDARLLSQYIKREKPEIYEKAGEKSEKIVGTIKDRFKSEERFRAGLRSNGITEEVLRKTHLDMNVKAVFEKEFKKNLEIDDQELEDYYNGNKGMFMLGESILAKNCLIKADARSLDKQQMAEKKEKAETVLQLMKNGRQERAFQMCDNGTYPPEQRIYKFTEGYPVGKILKLEEGSFGGPYKNIYGFLVVKAEKRFGNEPVPFEEVKGNIKRIMEKSRFKERYNDIIERMRDETDIEKYLLKSSDSD